MPPQLPDLTDPRYLDEVGWFLHHERYGREKFGASYDAERRAYSQLLLDECWPTRNGMRTGWRIRAS